MARLIATTITITNLASSSGAARLQLFAGEPISGQTLIADCELTAAQNAAMQTALAATSGTVTSFNFASAAAPLPGIFNAM